MMGRGQPLELSFQLRNALLQPTAIQTALSSFLTVYGPQSLPIPEE